MHRLQLLSALPLVCILACGGERTGPDLVEQGKCAEAVQRYSDLYVGKWGDHADPAFDEILDFAKTYEDFEDGSRDDCRTLMGIADVIRYERGEDAGQALGATCLAKPDHAGVMSFSVGLGFFLFLLGGLIAGATGIWLVLLAFERGLLWGLAYLVVPFASIAFVVVAWQRAHRPFLANMAAGMVMTVGMLLFFPYLQGVSPVAALTCGT